MFRSVVPFEYRQGGTPLFTLFFPELFIYFFPPAISQDGRCVAIFVVVIQDPCYLLYLFVSLTVLPHVFSIYLAKRIVGTLRCWFQLCLHAGTC
ncbi:hypothetical protein GDO86_018250 [Hymenochirus boettgeri]|uniref:Uncharacterized protein n=1 Tax=Hymenochirus boettgeri TaxID=247094 RepID=A0A8T2IES7_9PIPI|nr:hypothetical protein GDO86_018250 [Hymenochirus boettgeri]